MHVAKHAELRSCTKPNMQSKTSVGLARTGMPPYMTVSVVNSLHKTLRRIYMVLADPKHQSDP
jgi:hypothetical protein